MSGHSTQFSGRDFYIFWMNLVITQVEVAPSTNQQFSDDGNVLLTANA